MSQPWEAKVVTLFYFNWEKIIIVKKKVIITSLEEQRMVKEVFECKNK